MQCFYLYNSLPTTYRSSPLSYLLSVSKAAVKYQYDRYLKESGNELKDHGRSMVIDDEIINSIKQEDVKKQEQKQD